MAVPIPPSQPDRSGVRRVEDTVEGDFHRQLELSVPQYEPGVERRIQNVVIHDDNAEFCSSPKRSKRARLDIFGCTFALDRTVRVQTSCLLTLRHSDQFSA